MRVIKQNTLTYESFHKSLPYLTKSAGPGGSHRFIHMDMETEENKSVNKNLNLILEFKENISKSKTNDQVFALFENILKQILNIGELNIFFQSGSNSILTPFYPSVSERMKFFVKSQFKKGLIKEIITFGKPKLILDSLVYNIDGSRMAYMIFPLGEEDSAIEGRLVTNGILVISLTSVYKETSTEINLVQLCLKFVLSQLALVNKQKELRNKIVELQTYQSKLANDYKLSAIGELTSGIVEEILSPMQVIASTTELMRGDEKQVDGEILDTINAQVKKVKKIINNLIRFAGNNDAKSKVQPCNVNELINEFYMLTVSSLSNDKYECITDLEANLPPVITKPNFIYQLLTNIFSIIRSKKGNEGGILIQTKYRDEKVEIKFLTTDYEENLSQKNLKNNKDINLKILTNLMASHEGEIFIDSNKTNGTVINLSFPIKRNLGK